MVPQNTVVPVKKKEKKSNTYIALFSTPTPFL